MDTDRACTATPVFLAGGGEMGALMRAHDWRRSPLGPPEGWPDALKMAVSLCLHSRFPLMLWWGPEHVMLYNDACRPIAGARKHPAGLGRPGREVWPDVWDRLGPQLDAVLREGVVTSTKDSRSFVDRSGYLEEAYFTFSLSPIRDASSGIGGVFGAVQETTEAVLSERRLDLLRRVAEATADRRGPVEAARAADAVLTGHPTTVFSLIYLIEGSGPARLVSVPFGDAPADVPLDGGDCWGIGRTFRTGEPTVLDDLPARFGPMPSAPWPEAPVQAVALPLARPGGQGSGAGVLVVGVNPRRRLDDAYLGFLGLLARQVAAGIDAAGAYAAERARTEELRAVLDAIPTAVWYTRDPDGAVAWGNRQAATLLRLPQGGLHEVGGESHARLGFAVHRAGERLPPAALPLARAARGEDVPAEEYEIHFHDGARRAVLSRARPLRDAAGKVTGAVLAVADVTERKRFEADLRRANETLEARVAERTAALERSLDELRTQMTEHERMAATLRRMQRLEAIGQLTAGLAHDFNNLLTVILGNVEFLARDLPDGARRRLAAVRAAADRGASLTGQLLAFARRQQLRPRAVQLNEVVAGMTDLLRTTAGGMVEVRLSPQKDVWPALVDANQVELVILNLALNARDAMPDGGILTIATHNTRRGPPHTPEQPAEGDYVTLTVADTGTGMSPDVLGRVFEPFFTTKPIGKGSGLGLAQVYGFAQQSGGDVEIESAPGAGTRVHVHLPRAYEEAAEPERSAPPPRPGGRRTRVMLVDDDATVRDVTTTMLQDAGFTVIATESGQAALATLEARAPVDLLVADFAMPGLSGADLVRVARAGQPDLPVLVITGDAEAGALRGLEGVALLRKPFRGGDLVARVTRLLGAGSDDTAGTG